MLVAVVLGNKLNDDGTPSDIMLRRMALAKQMYFLMKPDKIILSGGSANKKAGKTEAQFMRRYLVDEGIPNDVLIEEGKSMTTQQNAQFSVPIALQLGAKAIVVVTTAEHMSRGYLNPLKLFQSQLKGRRDVNLYGYCVDLKK